VFALLRIQILKGFVVKFQPPVGRNPTKARTKFRDCPRQTCDQRSAYSLRELKTLAPVTKRSNQASEVRDPWSADSFEAQDASSLTWDVRTATSAERGLESVRGFTLVELLIVAGIMGLLLVLIAPAFTSMKSGADFTNSVYGIQGVLENARTYAKTNRTYVFVGFAEVDSSVDPSASPQLAGNGRVAVAVVASKDGTRHFQYAASNQGADWQANYADSTKPEYRGAHLTPVGKLQRFENLHFVPLDFGSWSPTTHPNSKMARYQPTGPPYILGNSASTSVTPFTWPLGSLLNSGYQYRFDRVICFDPTGIARIATSTNEDTIVHVMEIDFQPSHGAVIPPVPSDQDVGNHAVVQLGTTNGAVRVYRP
jgi:prepilin-type N-terminal cleavage/methylation domain-containing protein